MPDLGEKARGQNTDTSLMEVVESLQKALDTADAPAVALSDVTEISDYSRQTVNDRLTDAKKADSEELGGIEVLSEQVAGSNIYWIAGKESEQLASATPAYAATQAASRGSKRALGETLNWGGWKYRLVRELVTWGFIHLLIALGAFFVSTGSPAGWMPEWTARFIGLWLFTLGITGLVLFIDWKDGISPYIRAKVSGVGAWCYRHIKLYSIKWSK